MNALPPQGEFVTLDELAKDATKKLNQWAKLYTLYIISSVLRDGNQGLRMSVLLYRVPNDVQAWEKEKVLVTTVTDDGPPF